MARRSESRLAALQIETVSRSSEQAWNDSMPQVLCRHHTLLFNTV
jgi:hypothetical protein